MFYFHLVFDDIIISVHNVWTDIIEVHNFDKYEFFHKFW